MRTKRLIVLLVLAAVLFPFMLNALECSVCSKKIRGQYIKNRKNQSFCSRKCFNSTLPKCENCRKICTAGVFTLQNKNFCSKSCMHQTFKCSCCGRGLITFVTVVNSYGTTAMLCPNCRSLPKCVYCSMPSSLAPLADGRHICRECSKTAVKDPQRIRTIFQQVRSDLARMFGYDNRHRIQLLIVDAQELEKEAHSTYTPTNGQRMALMKYSEKVQTTRRGRKKSSRVVQTTCQIFVLDSIPEIMLYDVLAHELTHDFLRHKVGKIRDNAKEEGFCELAAALYNQKRGAYFLNRAKNANPDPVYGGGFRTMYSHYRRVKSLHKVLPYLR